MAGLDLVTTDAGELYDRAILAAEQAVGEPLYPGDERRIFVEALLAVLVPLANSIEDAAEQTTLQYARGQVLDALGERLGVYRLEGSAATCTLRFSLDETRKVATAIPKWTKAKPSDEVYFATDRDAVIPAGELSVDVPATCTEPGELGNGYPAGSVTTPVDLIAYVNKVTNLDETSGGDDGETYTEVGDDHFRERIRLAPESLSVAGPEGAYIYWAKTADADIVDVAAISETEPIERELEVADSKVYMGGDLLVLDDLTVNDTSEGFTYTYEDSLLTITLQEPLSQEETVTVKLTHKMDGRVRIVPLMAGGGLPTQDVLDRVYEVCNAKDKRPMTDLVRVDTPTEVDYSINLEYWTTQESEAAVVDAVEGVGGAIEQYVAQQCARLGRDINPDVLRTMIMDAGAIRVEITEPVYTSIRDDEVPHYSGSLTARHTVEMRARWES